LDDEPEFYAPTAVFNPKIARDCDRAALIAELQEKRLVKGTGHLSKIAYPVNKYCISHVLPNINGIIEA
jgi:hypothetical protein